jgi:hypothetical protein
MRLHREAIFGLGRIRKSSIDHGRTKELIRGPTEDVSLLYIVSIPSVGPEKGVYLGTL